MKRVISLVLCVVFILTFTISVSALKAVPVKSISLDKNSVTLEVGNNYNFKVTFTPANTTQKLLNYSTSNKNVADVSAKGVVSATGAGKAVITVTSTANKSAAAKLSVTVTQQPRTKLSMCMSQTGWGGEAVDPELMKDVQKVIENKTNTELEVIAPPQSTYSDKLNVLLASGQVPDVFHIMKAMANVQIYAARGYLMNLDPYIKGYPDITSQVKKQYMDYLRVQGNLMAVPLYRPLSKVIWMRKGILDLYGVKLSTTPTTDEFYNEMKKIDSKRFIPFSFAKFLDNLPFFFNPFGGYYGIGIKNGNFYDGFNTQGAKDALAYCAKLYKAKIWDQEFLTTENAGMREKLYSGKAASALDYYNRYIYYAAQSYMVNKPSEFVPVYELKGPNHLGGNLYEAIQDALAVSAKCKNPKKALDVIRYYAYTTEGVNLRMLGIQGEHYNIKDGKITPTDKAKNSGYNCTVNGYFLYYPTITTFPFKWDNVTEELMPKQFAYNKEIQNHLGPKFIIPGGKSDLYDKNSLSYQNKINEISSKIITGALSVDAGYQQYISFWKSINGDEMLKQLNK